MNKLLALSIALLSLNLYGADEPIQSPHGLEGWGKTHGVRIMVIDHSKEDKTFDVKAIKNQVELKLRLAGIKINQRLTTDTIYINMLPRSGGGRVIGYGVRVRPQRRMNFKYNGKEYIAFGSSKTTYGGSTPKNYRQAFDEHLDELLLDYLKANPKPKEKKSLIEP